MVFKRPNAQSVVVTGMGMISSLGFDVITSCAAARAGISRAAEIEDVSVYEDESGEIVPVIGHVAAGGITKGFAGMGRLARLGEMALKDLMRNSGLTPEDLSRTWFVLSLSGGYYWSEFHRRDLEPVSDSLPFAPERIIDAENRKRQHLYRSIMIPRLSKLTGISFEDGFTRLHVGEQATVVSALEEAFVGVQSGEMETCLVGGIDSLVEARLIESIFNLGLLKSAVNPTGFLAGEGAAFVQLERYDRALSRGRRRLAILDRPSVQAEKVHRFSDVPVFGRSTSEAVLQSMTECLQDNRWPGLIIGNLNGDNWRATDWGTALLRLPESLRAAPQWYPLESFGEIGAASGAVAMCVAIQAFQRGYADTETILVWLCGDDGKSGSFVLRSYPLTGDK